MKNTGAVYDGDFYAWTQQQAELLRRLPTVGNELDPERIAEEIEDLGRSELRAAQSLCEHIIEHFLKLEYAGPPPGGLPYTLAQIVGTGDAEWFPPPRNPHA